MERVDCVVVGAGVVGLAVARALARSGREVLVLEAEAAFGTGTSSRNSEVIHAGIYYPPGSLKARLCVNGKRLLRAFCDAHGVAYRLCGKLIVATDAAQATQLQAIRANARACGVDDLQWLSASEVRALEPALAVDVGLLSPSTGIIDSHGLMLALLGDAEAHGATLATGARVTAGRIAGDGIALAVQSGDESMWLHARSVVNGAGLGAVALAHAIEDVPPSAIPTAYLAKGSYFTCATRSPFTHLVYPLPEPGGLGVHLTLDLAGQMRFGPDVAWIDEIDYAVDPTAALRFDASVRRFWPGLPPASLQPAYAGIRPKISGPGQPAADFRLDGPDVHGVPGLVNLFGIESPGLTASLALAAEVAAMLGDRAMAA